MSLPTFGEWLKMYLREHKVRQNVFAQQIGVSPQHVHDLVWDRRPPSARLVVTISATTGASIDLLFILAGLCPPSLRTRSTDEVETFFDGLKEGQ